jgi:hypothetical protein
MASMNENIKRCVASSAFNRFSYSELPDCANESSLDDGELETLRRAPAVLGGPERGEGGESEPGDDCEACQDSSVSSSPQLREHLFQGIAPKTRSGSRTKHGERGV